MAVRCLVCVKLVNGGDRIMGILIFLSVTN